MRIRPAVFIFAAVSALSAQPLTFEVASVKENRTGEPAQTYPRLRNGTFTAEKASLRTLLVIAFGLSELRINAPDWIDTERYDIAARAPEGVPDSQIMPLLQSLLKDRFHMESHFETKEVPVYDMVLSKSGPKLKPFDPAHPPAIPQNYGHGEAATVGVGTTSQIADALERAAGRPVVDKTGMEGRFGWTLLYTPFSGNANSDSAAPDIFTAIEQQLGLKLEPKKESLQVLFIDHVERVPTEN